MVVLSGADITKAFNDKLIIIEPFNPANLTNVAYDVSLGRVAYFKSIASEFEPVDVTNSRDSWERVDVSSDDCSGITIPPGQVVMAHTDEFIGSRPGVPITTLLRARSTMCRAGVAVSPSAGWGDVGFASRWGLLLHNMRSDRSVYIPFGTRIAQIAFLTVSSVPEKSYAETSGTYDCSVFDKWSPEMLLPAKKKIT